MPRTKVYKSSKRNREKEDIMNERLREYDAAADHELSTIALRFSLSCENYCNEFTKLTYMLKKKTLEMTLHDLFTYGENINSTDSMNSSRLMNGSIISGTVRRQKSKDEGYLTEDSTNAGPTNQLPMIKSTIGRTPGPLSSAIARSRRSRSACGYLNSAIKGKLQTGHNSRTKLRTPQPTPRGQVFSVDRAQITPKINGDSPPALYRWAKQGETIISLAGSPVVAQMTPDFVANVNIPIRNGMLSLRPKKLDEINKSMVNKIDSETIQQIKQLQSNLTSILKFAEQS